MDNNNHFTDSAAAGSTHSSNTCTSSSSTDNILKQLNRNSLKISKPPPPIRNSHGGFGPLMAAAAEEVQSQPSALDNPHPHHQQPPVYNVSKNDFRDVVQRLTGSPAAVQNLAAVQPKPQSSRLQRIRPPPLAHLSARPPNLLNCAVPYRPVNDAVSNFRPQNDAVFASQFQNPNPSVFSGHRQPLSPLPPLPSVHAAAESPISAYLRFLQGSNSVVNSMPPQMSSAPPVSLPAVSSPLPFGCLPSPKSPYPLISPTHQFPLSPTPQVQSPRWKGL